MIVTIIVFRLTGAGNRRSFRRRRRRKQKLFTCFLSHQIANPIFKIAKKHNMESDDDKNGKENSKTKKNLGEKLFPSNFQFSPCESSQGISLISTRIFLSITLERVEKSQKNLLQIFPSPAQKFHISPEKTRSRARMMLVLRRTLTQMWIIRNMMMFITTLCTSSGSSYRFENLQKRANIDNI